METTTKQVKIGPKFFANELRVYRDWVTAFWRENLQNSFDAGASRIDITVGETFDGVANVIFADNGKGMDRKTIEDVYFTLGETTKDSGDSVGGFGKARILTCFAQKEYSLATNNLFVKGCGADYEIEESEVSIRGTKLSINLFTKGRDLLEPLTAYLKKCHLEGCAVYVNGKRHTDWTYKNKHERDLTFGSIYTNKSKEAGILVRVNGVQMFSPYTSAPFLVIVEISQNRSREVLQASRDGLLYDFQEELESFVAEININKQSALRAKRNKSTHYEGTGTFTSKRSKQKDAEKEVEEFANLLVANNLSIEDSVLERMKKATAENRAEVIQKILEANNLFTPETKGVLHSSGAKEDNKYEDLTFDMFSTIVVDNTTNEKVRKVIESYYPNNWDLLGVKGSRYDKRYGETRSFRAGVEKYKLLILWKAACEFALRLLQDELQKGGSNIGWGVGWLFSDSGQAMHKRSDGVEWLLLNPTDASGKMRLSLSDKPSMAKLVALACHEVAHIVYSDHDEAFANLLDDLHEQAFLFKTEMLQHMKAAKEAAESELNSISGRKAVA